MRTKNFTAYLLVNWKTGDMRMYKTKPSSDKVGQYGKVVKVNIELEAPEVSVQEVSEELQIPQSDIEEVISEEVENLEEENNSRGVPRGL